MTFKTNRSAALGLILVLGIGKWLAAAMPKATDPAEKALPPPAHVRGEPQDSQAARLQWDRVPGAAGYFLYAARDGREPADFFQENTNPIHQEFVIWDAPKSGPRRFRFKVSAIDPQGKESEPSEEVRVDLDATSANDPRPSRRP